jgi:long-chain acyl-CoA synthetase
MLSAEMVHQKKAEITAEGQYFEVEPRDVGGRSYLAYKHAPATLIDVLQSGRNHGDLEFIVYEGTRYSYNDFYRAVDALGAYLQITMGVNKGDRVALAMRNNPEWAITYVAASLIGAIVVPINSWGKSEELMYALTDSKASVLVCDPPRFQLIADELGNSEVKTIVAGGASAAGILDFDACVAAGKDLECQVAEADPEEPCVILYTSGSTGFPKGVVHRHVAVCQSLMNMMWLGFMLMELEGAREYKGGAERETPLLTVPLFHATGLLGSLLMPLQMGQKLVMMYKWDSNQALDLIESEKITSLSTVPAIVQDLLSNPRFDEANTESLIRVAGAGAATPAGLPELIDEKCGKPSRSAGWGMTETMAVGGTMSGCVFDLKPDSAGIQSPIMEMRFVDADGNDMPAGEPGELLVYGVCCTPGYWNKPEANEKTFDANGWMETGDIAKIDDDGFLHITGRIKEIVIRGGENIYPGEIENVAYRLDQVRENVVFGVPDTDMGEEMVMVAYVPTEDVTAEELRAHLSASLATYKVPKFIEVVSQPLPKNASEKLHKLKVKEKFQEANPG